MEPVTLWAVGMVLLALGARATVALPAVAPVTAGAARVAAATTTTTTAEVATRASRWAPGAEATTTGAPITAIGRAITTLAARWAVEAAWSAETFLAPGAVFVGLGQRRAFHAGGRTHGFAVRVAIGGGAVLLEGQRSHDVGAGRCRPEQQERRWAADGGWTGSCRVRTSSGGSG
jgi:hypothetical protein